MLKSTMSSRPSSTPIRHSGLQCDVLVAGGGPAGVPCALAAARAGANVILVHDRAVLGGNASSEIRMHVVGADCHGKRGKALAVEAREGGIMEEIRLEQAVHNPQRSATMLDLTLYDLCRNQPNLTLLLNATLDGVEMSGGKIAKAFATRASTEECFEITARIFVDCTGDGRLGAEAGADFRRGREGMSEFGESLAQRKADSHSLGSSLLFQARKHDVPMPFVAPKWARKMTPQDVANERLHFQPGEPAEGLDYGFWWLEWGGHLDTIADNEHIRDEVAAILFGVWDHIKNSGLYPGAEFWALEWFGFLPGKRESRRFWGQTILTEHDVVESRPHADAIAYGGWYVDTHPPKGVDSPEEPPCVQHWVKYLFDIPLGCCISRNIPNLMFAGRNISATHVAFASTRVMATCAIIGQAVGIAAAHAIGQGLEPADLCGNPAAISRIQQKILREDGYLIGIGNKDDADLARAATISASSELPDAPATNVVSGYTRSVHGKDGAPPDRVVPGTHRWISDPAEGVPAWLQLEWPEPVVFSEIRIVFDTGLHRELTLSMSENVTAKMCWGKPQPETVRDYRIEACNGSGHWQPLFQVSNNYSRLVTHRTAAPVTAQRLRITVETTNGAPEARIMEVRVENPLPSGHPSPHEICHT